MRDDSGAVRHLGFGGELLFWDAEGGQKGLAVRQALRQSVSL